MNDTRHNRPARPIDLSEDASVDERKRVILGIAVTVATLIIVVAWLLILPLQLEDLRLLDNESVARWYVIREELNQEAGGIQGELDRLKKQLDRAAVDLESTAGRGTADDALVPSDVAKRLRDKIMESGSITQTEQDAAPENQ